MKRLIFKRIIISNIFRKYFSLKICISPIWFWRTTNVNASVLKARFCEEQSHA